MNTKPLRWLHGEVKTPPIFVDTRREIGSLLRDLQEGENLGMPHSRPMPSIGARCHELRVKTWRVFYRIDPDAIIILDVCEKKTQQTPAPMIRACQRRLQQYEVSKP